MPKFLTVAFAALLATSTLPHTSAQDEETLVFILAGQSNMVGQGDTAALSEDLRRLPPNVRYYLDGESVGIAAGNRFGPEVTFADELAEAYPEKTIVLIKFALGGSSLLAWAPDWTPEAAELTENRGQGPLYRRLMEYVSSSRSAHPRNARLAAVLWMQGERDARFPAAGEQYGANLSVLVDRIREDLDAPDLPFIFGQVNPPPERYPASEEVRNAQQAAERLIRGATMVSTEGLAKHDDDLHYNTAGQLELGRRFARAYLAMRGR